MGSRILDETNLPEWLSERGLVPAGAKVTITPAGDGNINWVQRVARADGASLIVKQARPSLEKFPEYEADTRRIVTEFDWLEVAGPLDTGAVCPRVLYFDEEDRVLVLEDLGEAERLDSALRGNAPLATELAGVGALLGRVHRATWEDSAMARRFPATDMRDLHFAHIYDLPFEKNDFPLSPVVAERAQQLRDGTEVLEKIAAAREDAHANAHCVQHADPQPGNILLTATGPKLLDAEIAHFGDPAFDPGNLLGHLGLASLPGHRVELLRARASAWWDSYREAVGAERAPCFPGVVAHAAVEMLRRTIGAARVTFVEQDDHALAAIETACSWLREPPALPGDLQLRRNVG